MYVLHKGIAFHKGEFRILHHYFIFPNPCYLSTGVLKLFDVVNSQGQAEKKRKGQT